MTHPRPRDGKVIVTPPHKRFLDQTRGRYNDLKHRVRKFYKFPSLNLPYTLDQYRDWVRKELGGEGGAARCYYCDALVNSDTMQTEHRLPLAQAGPLHLSNLAVSCEFCNQQKGAMRAQAFSALLRLVNDRALFSQVDRDNLLGRLQIAMKLAWKEQARRKREAGQCPLR